MDMSVNRNLLISIGLLLTFLAKADSYYESQIAAQLAEGKQAGELIQLEALGASFIGLYRQPTITQPQGAIILLHHMGGHPDWPQIVGPLRTQLPRQGWATLSIQMPILSPGEPIADYGKTLQDARARIGVALQYLEGQDYENIVIVGYSFGAALAADYLATTKRTRIIAFVGIGMQTQAFLSPRLELIEQLGKIRIPVLDIYGSRDFEDVLRQAKDRRMIADKAGNSYYHQRLIEGADHYFTSLQGVLSRTIRGWLDKLIKDEQMMDEMEETGTEKE